MYLNFAELSAGNAKNIKPTKFHSTRRVRKGLSLKAEGVTTGSKRVTEVRPNLFSGKR
ncbi:UNVERIFIED_CONTAM: hypothetical protein GTU68_062406 [Idotea baltica]|nr:hypothetical protein [Idotea baltica]